MKEKFNSNHYLSNKQTEDDPSTNNDAKAVFSNGVLIPP